MGRSRARDIMESAEPMEELLRWAWEAGTPRGKFRCRGGGPPVTAFAAARAVAAALSSLLFWPCIASRFRGSFERHRAWQHAARQP